MIEIKKINIIIRVFILVMENLFRAKKTTVEMAIDRGYEVHEDINYLDDEIPINESKTRQELSVLYSHSTVKNKYLYVAFVSRHVTGNQHVSKSEILKVHDALASLMKLINGDKNVEVAIVGDSEINSNIKDALDKDMTDYYYQYFSENELKFNPNKSKYNSKADLLSEAEASALLKKMGISIGETCLMSEADPIARYYAFRPGDLIRFTRNTYEINAFCPVSVGYRTVIAVPPNL